MKRAHQRFPHCLPASLMILELTGGMNEWVNWSIAMRRRITTIILVMTTTRWSSSSHRLLPPELYDSLQLPAMIDCALELPSDWLLREEAWGESVWTSNSSRAATSSIQLSTNYFCCSFQKRLSLGPHDNHHTHPAWLTTIPFDIATRKIDRRGTRMTNSSQISGESDQFDIFFT